MNSGVSSLAVRVARSSPAFPLAAAADAAQVPVSRLRRRLGTLRWRGRCDGIAARAATADTRRPLEHGLQRRFAALTARQCPPPLMRTVTADDRAVLRRSVAGVAGWRARRVEDSATAAARAVIAAAAGDSSRVSRATAARHECRPFVVQVALAGDKDAGVRSGAAAPPGCDPRMLRVLARDQTRLVRESVAQNPNCGADILAELATDPVYAVRASVADNPNCDPGTLALLARDQNDVVCCFVARNPRCDTAVVAELAHNLEVSVRASVADNPNCDPGILAELARDPNTFVRQSVAKNPRCGVDTLDRWRWWGRGAPAGKARSARSATHQRRSFNCDEAATAAGPGHDVSGALRVRCAW